MTNDRSPRHPCPEIAVLLACARPSLTEPQKGSLADLLRAGLDWDLLRRLSLRHALLPLLHRRLAGPLRALVPAAVQESLDRAARTALAQSTLLTEELKCVLRALAARKLHALAYKGPAMAVQIHGHATLRTYRDLDILVTRSDVFAARRALANIGYQPSEPLAAAQEEAQFHTECDRALVNASSGATVELHWAVAPPYLSFPLETERLLARSTIVDVDGVSASVPSAEDLLLLLAMNGAKDCWLSLEPSTLIAGLLEKQALDWAAVRMRARDLRAQRMLSLALRLARDLVGATLPEVALAHDENDPELAALVESAKSHLLTPFPRLMNDRAIMRFRARTREHWADRARHYLLRGLMPSAADCGTVPLPRALWFAGALVRPFRLLAGARRHNERVQ